MKFSKRKKKQVQTLPTGKTHRTLVLVKGDRQMGSQVNPTATPISALVKRNRQMRFQVDQATNIDFFSFG